MTTAVETAPPPPPATAAEVVETPPFQSKIQNPKSKILFADTVLVFALTLIAGLLRFMFIDRPPLWGDDAFTFMRICGTYEQMLDALQDWGFAPLHYELYWWMAQHTTMTPFMMRLVPAIAGTLMVPAMYWLGRELTANRKVALVAALFAATSGYLLNYSRDAKMYMHFWLMCTVNVAALLWWLRARSGVAWWSWVASGVAMLGLNMLGLAVIGIELLAVIVGPRAHWGSFGKLLLLVLWIPIRALVGALQLIGAAPDQRPPLDWTINRAMSRFRWPAIVLFGLGVGIMCVGPYGYYRHFNQYADRIEEGGLGRGGLGWVEGYNRGRDTFDLIAFTATAHLYSWEWPRRSDETNRRGEPLIDDAKEIDPRVVKWLKTAGIVILSLLAIGLFPWPRAWTGFGSSAAKSAGFWTWWRALLLVSAWIILPAYAFYCASVDEIVSPNRAVTDLGRGAWEFLTQIKPVNIAISVGILAFLIGAFILSGRSMRERLFTLAGMTAIVAGLFIICWMIYGLYERQHEGSVWMPRYLGFAWPAVAIGVAVLLLRLPTRPLRWAAVALLIGVNLAVFSARLFAGSEVPTPIMARDLIDSQPNDATVRMYYHVRNAGRGGPPGTGYLWSLPGSYYLTIYSGKPTNPQEFLTGFGGGLIARKFKRWETRMFPLPQYVANDARKTPRLQRLIVWENFTPRQTVKDDDPVLGRLGSGWTRADEQIFRVRDHWTWRNLMTLRRRVYEHTTPSTAPATTAPEGARDGR